MSEEEEDMDRPLSTLGEREIIERLISKYDRQSTIGLGDDCGAIEIDNRLLLISTDSKSSESHFPSGFTSYDMGWNVAAANLSDIAAMGGSPIGFAVAYVAPKTMVFRELSGIQDGILSCLSEYNVPFLAADTKEGESLVITGTALGMVDKNQVLTRKGSRSNDIVCISGYLGGALLGLRSLIQNLGLENAEQKMRRPKARIDVGKLLAGSNGVTSCIDISDGLSSSLYELMRASGNGFEVDASKIPIHDSLHSIDMPNEERIEIALHSGDEYELLFTVAPEMLKALRKNIEKRTGSDVFPIGHVTDEKEIILCCSSGKKPLEDHGYEHFKSKSHR